MEEIPVGFFSGGVELAGVLYLPESSAPAPGIVLCQGYTGTKEMFLPILAQAFREAGCAALIFDYRGWGESRGERGRIVPREQVEDIRNALTFLSARPEVDAARLGLYGTSFGGGNVVYTGAVDARVRCVVATLAIGDGRRWLRSLRRLWEWNEFLDRLEADRRERVATGRSRLVPAFEIVPPDPAMRALMDAAAQAGVFSGGQEAMVTLESAEAIMEFAPEEALGAGRPVPMLFIHAGSDTLVSPEESRRLHERAAEPKQLVILPGVNHVDFYLGDALDRVVATSSAWFRRHLIDSTSHR